MAVASDNTRDQFFAYGDLDLLDVFGQVLILYGPAWHTVWLHMHNVFSRLLLGHFALRRCLDHTCVNACYILGRLCL